MHSFLLLNFFNFRWFLLELFYKEYWYPEWSTEYTILRKCSSAESFLKITQANWFNVSSETINFKLPEVKLLFTQSTWTGTLKHFLHTSFEISVFYRILVEQIEVILRYLYLLYLAQWNEIQVSVIWKIYPWFW